MFRDKKTIYILVAFLVVVLCPFVLPGLLGFTLWMPGKSYKGDLPALTIKQKTVSDNLRRHVEKLSGEIGERNLRRYTQLEEAALYITDTMEELGYEVRPQHYIVDGKPVRNIQAEIKGKSLPDEIIVIGAHYDTVVGSPGADDNASGVAGVLEMARLLARARPERTVRFVLFVCEEQPHFTTHEMGSRQYAKRCRSLNENIVAMFAIEMIGYYSDRADSQKYPSPFQFLYPRRGNFIGFIGNTRSKNLLLRSIEIFRSETKFPSQGIVAPEWTPGGIWRSDHGSFWEYGYPGIMITDSAEFRNPYYHSDMDTPDKIDYDSSGRVVTGLASTVTRLADSSD